MHTIPPGKQHIAFGCIVKVNCCQIGTEGPGVSVSEERQSPAESSGVTVIYNPYASLSIEQQRQKLPVFKVQEFFWGMLNQLSGAWLLWFCLYLRKQHRNLLQRRTVVT